jgi:hypothetical protein
MTAAATRATSVTSATPASVSAAATSGTPISHCGHRHQFLAISTCPNLPQALWLRSERPLADR